MLSNGLRLSMELYFSRRAFVQVEGAWILPHATTIQGESSADWCLILAILKTMIVRRMRGDGILLVIAIVMAQIDALGECGEMLRRLGW